MYKSMDALTRKGDRAINGEDTCFATVVTELAVGMTWEDFTAITTQEFDVGGALEVKRRFDHTVKVSLLRKGLKRRFWKGKDLKNIF